MMLKVCFVNICMRTFACVSLGVTIQSIAGAIDWFSNGNNGCFRVRNIAARSHRNVAGPNRPVSNWIKCQRLGLAKTLSSTLNLSVLGHRLF